MKAYLGGYSDDCANVSIDDQDPGFSEYTEKRLVVTLPNGAELTGTLQYNGSWGVYFDIPDDCTVRAEEKRAEEWVDRIFPSYCDVCNKGLDPDPGDYRCEGCR